MHANAKRDLACRRVSLASLRVLCRGCHCLARVACMASPSGLFSAPLRGFPFRPASIVGRLGGGSFFGTFVVALMQVAAVLEIIFGRTPALRGRTPNMRLSPLSVTRCSPAAHTLLTCIRHAQLLD